MMSKTDFMIYEKIGELDAIRDAAQLLIEDVRDKYGIKENCEFTCPYMRELDRLLGKYEPPQLPVN